MAKKVGLDSAVSNPYGKHGNQVAPEALSGIPEEKTANKTKTYGDGFPDEISKGDELSPRDNVGVERSGGG